MSIPFQSVRERWHADPEYQAAYEEVSPAMDLAFAMAEARQAAKLSQAEVARRIGTSQAMVARWETGKTAPTTTSLRRFAEATGARLRIEFAFERN
ncbi:helix-turn-helix transcriptional regulator [Methylobacterium sp. EM32]|uniref:helix-turn-helix domain-containing protein n=1 Tax=Methylobacterium sp. EM32 TaxID=3163481 RepID=UPI0033B735AA